MRVRIEGLRLGLGVDLGLGHTLNPIPPQTPPRLPALNPAALLLLPLLTGHNHERRPHGCRRCPRGGGRRGRGVPGCGPRGGSGGSPVEFVEWTGTRGEGTCDGPPTPWRRPASHGGAGVWGSDQREETLFATGVTRGGDVVCYGSDPREETSFATGVTRGRRRCLQREGVEVASYERRGSRSCTQGAGWERANPPNPCTLNPKP